MRKSSLAWPAPAPAEFKSQPIAQKHSIDRSAMLGQRSLLLVLLALLALAQQHGRGDQGAAPTFSAAPQGHWTPTASPAPPKAGECPAGESGAPWPPGLYCLSDHSCPGAEKCCQSGQVWTCLLPTTESPGYCPRAGSAIGPSCGASCHDDTACHSGEKCCTRGCCTRCVHAEPAKPGFCPRKRTQRSAAACPNRCTDDRDCPGDHKCCFSGCGLACAPPDTGSHHASAKPGTCPMVLRGSLGPCLELCDTDGDCLGDDKCCTTGCGHVCKPPTRVWPGLCPPAVDGNQADKCLLLCLQDKDCPTSQKCCQQGCSRVCIPPLWGTA
ncbi:WAP four-disulfide core domain protein 3-like isoform X2 [Manacus candei]|uniref:WAP four-disulfide core domain protein 3-like isoform X2 n=1 Tax=Manacus candei TaxID=415023 RepID=UPI0022277B0D|nr:WAP four-disulfide core domain protein 3-like isoform X2 [Manacus candei]